MSSWVGQAIRRGRLTTRYPAEPATELELPMLARAPRPPAVVPDRLGAIAACPVAALSAAGGSGIRADDGRCIRCARCAAHGFDFSGSAECSRPDRAGLLVPPVPSGPGARAVPLRQLGRSVHVFLVDAGSCNACNHEVLALTNPYYDAQRLGIFFTNSPRHADVLLVVGVPTAEMTEPVRRAFEALPSPKAVVAVGVCPIGGGVFQSTPGLAGSLEELVPVDAFVPGCPPAPVSVLDAILGLLGRSRARTEG